MEEAVERQQELNTFCLKEWDFLFMFSQSKRGGDGEQKSPEQTRDAEVSLADYLGGEAVLNA